MQTVLERNRRMNDASKIDDHADINDEGDNEGDNEGDIGARGGVDGGGVRVRNGGVRARRVSGVDPRVATAARARSALTVATAAAEKQEEEEEEKEEEKEDVLREKAVAGGVKNVVD